MWLTNLAAGAPSCRPVLLKVLFPHRDVFTEEVADQSALINAAGMDFPCVGNRLIKLMTAIEHATKHFATEFLYTLVNEDGTHIKNGRTPRYSETPLLSDQYLTQYLFHLE